MAGKREFIQHDGKDWQKMEAPMEYAEWLQKHGTPATYAEKSGCVLARKAKDGEAFPVYTQGSLEETFEHASAGEYILTKAGLDGQAVVDENGHVNQWKVSEETLRKKYAVPEGDFEDDTFAKPAGGEQKFVKLDRDVAFMVPWGKDRALVPQFVEKGGYMNVTNPNDVYGVSERDFADTYRVNREESEGPARVRELPEIDAPEAGNEGLDLG